MIPRKLLNWEGVSASCAVYFKVIIKTFIETIFSGLFLISYTRLVLVFFLAFKQTGALHSGLFAAPQAL